MAFIGQSRDRKGRFSSEFGVDVELIGAADLAYAIQVLGEKDAKRIAKLAVRDTLKDMQRTAQGAVAADKGETREQIQISLKSSKQGFQLEGRVGVGLRGGSRRTLAAIIEFGRRAFSQKIVGRNGKTYRVQIPAVPGQFYLTRAADRYLPVLRSEIAIEFERRIVNRIKRLAKKAGVK